jgi:hypothetical protein
VIPNFSKKYRLWWGAGEAAEEVITYQSTLLSVEPERASPAAHALFPNLMLSPAFSTGKAVTAIFPWCYSQPMKKLALAAFLLILVAPVAFASTHHHHHAHHAHAAHHHNHHRPA